MRRALLLVLAFSVAGLLGGCGAEEDVEPPAAEELTLFHGEGFEIVLPGAPEESSTSVPVPGRRPVELTTWSVPEDAGTMSVAVARYPAKVEVDLDAAARGAASEIGGRLRAVEKIRVDGRPGRDVVIDVRSNGQRATVFQRILLDGHTLFQVQHVASEWLKEPTERYLEVRDSLVID